ncbi:hypothetical protein OVA24_06240 [Luteolibacter sp. SL250]|uniref:hypothetical protein n=1 Tax=Luteolibacter sp. SL250 TaxID=2995170 RepID=UPI00226DD884|nr:hypothetical protein [Luteolibacter sp. SL250]WAC20980.1 hypothetical protein OVA24_06240 [Luteolibacter sp. SL250]
MISVQVIVQDNSRVILVEVQSAVKNRTGLNKVLAARWADELKDHFRSKNATPNKLGGKRTNFWNGVAADTGVAEVTEDGAVLTVANQAFRLHLHGGTVTPKKAKALTIPIVPEAHGLFARTYETTYGRKLFTISPKVPLLFERSNQATQSLTGQTDGRVRVRGNRPGEMVSKPVRIAARTPIRPVYYLADSVTIERDPEALPPRERVEAALIEEATDFLERSMRKGGLA